MRNKWCVAFGLSLLAFGAVRAQEEPPLPDGIDWEANRLIGRSALWPFFQKLRALDAGLLDRVSIVHIGDSHIQADWFTGYLRRELQQYFGQAGRGLVFPYRSAGTHGPVEVPDRSRGQLVARRKTFEHTDIPLGISGMTLRAQSPHVGFELRCADCPFDRVLLFHEGAAELLTPFAQASSFPFGTQWHFSHAVDTLSWRLSSPGAELYGLLLEDSRESGLLYHGIGVNGATFTHFNRAPLLLQQLPWLQPDLIILTLGTNEVLQPTFQAQDLVHEARQLIAGLRRARPGVPILLTTPPDLAPARSHGSPPVGKARRVLLELARSEQLACWDLYQVMGGEGSVRKWREQDLAHTDFIHFTKAGYELQARLLLEALSSAYGDAD